YHMGYGTRGNERVAQPSLPGEIGHDRQQGKEGAEEHHLTRRHGHGGLEHCGHYHKAEHRQNLECDAPYRVMGWLLVRSRTVFAPWRRHNPVPPSGLPASSRFELVLDHWRRSKRLVFRSNGRAGLDDLARAVVNFPVPVSIGIAAALEAQFDFVCWCVAHMCLMPLSSLAWKGKFTGFSICVA